MGASLRHGGSGALGLVDVAIGRQDGYAELHINLWDVAAALVILREAGAKVSDFMGKDGAVDGNPIVACAPGLAAVWSDLPGLRGWSRADGHRIDRTSIWRAATSQPGARTSPR